MATVHEMYRDVTGDTHNVEVGFLVRDAFSYVDAINILSTNAALPNGTPASFGGLPKQRPRAREISESKGLWHGTVTYSYESGKKAPLQSGFVPTGNLIDGYSWNVSLRNKLTRWLAEMPDGTGAVISTVVGNNPATASPFPAVDREGLNWQGEERGYEGFEIPRPEASFSLEYRPFDSDVYQGYLDRVEEAVGKTNSVIFHGKAVGEVLFTGARGEGRTGESWSFTFDFLVSKDRVSVPCGNGITTNIAGWDIVEMTMQRKRSTIGGEQVLTEIPRQARIIRPFQRADFATLLDATNP